MTEFMNAVAKTTAGADLQYSGAPFVWVPSDSIRAQCPIQGGPYAGNMFVSVPLHIVALHSNAANLNGCVPLVRYASTTNAVYFLVFRIKEANPVRLNPMATFETWSAGSGVLLGVDTVTYEKVVDLISRIPHKGAAAEEWIRAALVQEEILTSDQVAALHQIFKLSAG